MTARILAHIQVVLEDGSVADDTRQAGQPMWIYLGQGHISEAFEAQLTRLSEGDRQRFTLAAEDAFGPSNPDAVVHMERGRFSPDIALELGTIVAFSGVGGQQSQGVIRALAGDSVTVDFNHPLAGHRLTFDVEVLSRQTADSEV